MSTPSGAVELEQLAVKAREWLSKDPDPETQAQLSQMIEEKRFSELASCMTKLQFGTAGLRGVEGPGPGRMNLAVVIRTARGLADYLRRREPDASTLPIVVGFDSRRNSQRYAEVVVGVLVAARLNVRFFTEATPTPLVAYAAREYGAQAAVCVTASHNPRQYAGLKVYAANAVQIAAPADEHIAAAIEKVGPASGVPLEPSASWRSGGPTAEPIDAMLIERYYADVIALRTWPRAEFPLRIVYTPLHGVGGRHMLEVLRRSGHEDVHEVKAQFAPDPEFSTAPFPNPEEPGVLALALELATELNADLVLANDPDADRLAVCVPSTEGFRCLTGNQAGLLLADFVLRHGEPSPSRLVVTSVVSSPMLLSIAAAHGAKCVQTLTGFKWMLNAALQLEREQGLRFVFAFEEALGYCVAGPVRDKDGISAGLLFAEMTAEARHAGRSIQDELESLYRRHGVWASCQSNLALEATSDPLAQARAKLRRLAAEPPAELAGLSVRAVVDYRQGATERPWYLGSADLVEIQLESFGQLLVRPSGTEPKLKIYAHLKQTLQPDSSVAEQARLAERRVQQLADAISDFLH